MTQTELIDLLTDLRHLTASRDIDFEEAVRVSKLHHDAEQSNRDRFIHKNVIQEVL